MGIVPEPAARIEDVGRLHRDFASTFPKWSLARMASHPGAARMVGWALHVAPRDLDLPCHRVVNREGRTAPGWPDPRPLLEAEGVAFKPDGYVDLKAHLWRG